MVRSKDPKSSGYLKIQEKLKIIKQQAEEPHLTLRKLTDLHENIIYLFSNTYYLIIFNNCLICQRVYDQNRLNSSKARDLSRLEPKPTSLLENLRNFT